MLIILIHIIIQYWLNQLSVLNNSLGNPDNIENLIHMVRWIMTESSHYNITTLPHSYKEDVVKTL